jgi:uncharacterized membrane protein YccC
MTSDNSLSLIVRRLDEIERKLDDLEELRTTTAIRRRWQRRTNVWRKAADPREGALWAATRTALLSPALAVQFSPAWRELT